MARRQPLNIPSKTTKSTAFSRRFYKVSSWKPFLKVPDFNTHVRNQNFRLFSSVRMLSRFTWPCVFAVKIGTVILFICKWAAKLWQNLPPHRWGSINLLRLAIEKTLLIHILFRSTFGNLLKCRRRCMEHTMTPTSCLKGCNPWLLLFIRSLKGW